MPTSNRVIRETVIREEERLLGPLICFILGAALAIAGIRGGPTAASELETATAPTGAEEVETIRLPVSDELVIDPERRRGLAVFPIQDYWGLEIGLECVSPQIIEVERVRRVDAPAG